MKHKARKISDEIPTSSMADIAFLLIVFFMVTLTFAANQGLDFSIPPEDDSVTIDPVESVLVEIQPDARLRVDQRPMELSQLLQYLEPKLEQNPRKPVIIKPHPEASYGAMVAVYDELRRGKTVLALAEEIRIALPTPRTEAPARQARLLSGKRCRDGSE